MPSSRIHEERENKVQKPNSRTWGFPGETRQGPPRPTRGRVPIYPVVPGWGNLEPHPHLSMEEKAGSPEHKEAARICTLRVRRSAAEEYLPSNEDYPMHGF